jgi:hypothetical protein
LFVTQQDNSTIMAEKIHQYFQANIHTWLDNPHIKAAHTSPNEKKDYEVFLYVDDLNDESVVALKKSIEQEGHTVNLILQLYSLRHESVCDAL